MEWIPGTPEWNARQQRQYQASIGKPAVVAPLKPQNPVQNVVTGISNIFNTAATAAKNFVQAATVPVKSSQAVYSPGYSYTAPGAPLPPLYSSQAAQALPVPPQTYNVLPPLQTFMYNPPTSQPITVIVQPQPVTVNVPSSQTPVIGPFLPAIEQALSPFVAAIGQVVNPIIRAVNTLTQGEFSNISSAVNQATYQATNTLRDMVGGVKTDLQRQIDAANRSGSEQLRQMALQAERSREVFGAEFTDYKFKTAGTLSRLQDELNRYRATADITNREVMERLRQVDAQIEKNKQVAQEDIWAKFGKVLDELVKFSQNPGAAIEQGVSTSLAEVGSSILNGLKPAIDGYDKILNELKAGNIDDTADLLNKIQAVGGNAQVIAVLINIISIASLLIRGIFVTANPWIERIEQLVNAENKPNLLTGVEYVEYIRRFPNQSLWAFKQLYKLGLNDEQISVLFENGSQLLQLEQLVSADLRGIISEKEYDTGLNKLGYDDKQQKVINQLRFIIPPVQDLITMAVREVFNPEQRRLLSLDSEFPPDFGKYAQQMGLTSQWAQNYWAMHWQLISPQQLFEMLHRKQYDSRLKDVNEVFVANTLKAMDYAPVWRDKLMAISYNTPTRVDIRRMYKAGVFNNAQMHNAHLALGLSEVDANFLDDYVRKTSLPEDETDLDKIRNRIEKLLENRYIAGAIDENTLRSHMRSIGKSDDYTNQAIPLFAMEKHISGLENEAENIKQRSISAIISARQRGNISRTIAKRQLIALGLSDIQAEQSIIYADLQYTIKLKEKAQDVYQRQYALHNMEAPEFRKALEGYEFSADEITRALLESELMRADKTKKLTYSQLQNIRQRGIITEAQYNSELSALGLTSQSVTWLALLSREESGEEVEQ